MKLLLFARWRTESPGGPDAVVLNLAREFVALGHDVTVWSPNKGTREVSERRTDEGVAVVELPIFKKWPFLKQVTSDYLSAHGGDFDAALFFSVFTPLNILAARKIRCPYAAVPLGGYARGSMLSRGALRKRAFLALCERAFLERAAFINVWSRNEQDDVKLLIHARDYVITAPGFPFVPMPLHPPRRASPGRRLLFLGRFAIEHKGLDRLIDAFGRVAGPADRLTLAGADFRGSLNELQRRVAASPLRHQISVEGPAWGEEKNDLFRRHDVFVHLSRWEGLPLVVVEALAFGLPALVSKATNTGEYISAYDAGWVANDGAMDEGVRQALLSTDEEIARKGMNATRLVQNEFRWDAAASKLAEAFTTRHSELFTNQSSPR